jgi:hypothetical protein
MPKTPRVPNDTLLSTGLEMMRQNGKPLSKVNSPGRSMQYQLPNGESVRVRTSNDHILIVRADRDARDAKLMIEGTEWLLIVMPEVERTPGKVVAYLVPTKEVVEAARQGHQEWLATNPNTKGDNRTWNLSFRKDKIGASKAYSDFATKWSMHRLVRPAGLGQNTELGNIKAEVEAARQRIANAAGVAADAVRITIEFAAALRL